VRCACFPGIAPAFHTLFQRIPTTERFLPSLLMAGNTSATPEEGAGKARVQWGQVDKTRCDPGQAAHESIDFGRLGVRLQRQAGNEAKVSRVFGEQEKGVNEGGGGNESISQQQAV